jgi:predicted SprT family Zn-dependent metalloprotease
VEQSAVDHCGDRTFKVVSYRDRIQRPTQLTARTRHADGSKTESVKIVLSEKVLTGKDQILCTVAHEMCHRESYSHPRLTHVAKADLQWRRGSSVTSARIRMAGCSSLGGLCGFQSAAKPQWTKLTK